MTKWLSCAQCEESGLVRDLNLLSEKLRPYILRRLNLSVRAPTDIFENIYARCEVRQKVGI